MKKYIIPEINFQNVNTADIITLSTIGLGDGNVDSLDVNSLT